MSYDKPALVDDRDVPPTAVDSTPKQAAAVSTKPSLRAQLEEQYGRLAAEYGHAQFQLENVQDRVRDLKRQMLQMNAEFARLESEGKR